MVRSFDTVIFQIENSKGQPDVQRYATSAFSDKRFLGSKVKLFCLYQVFSY
jgi:hypothetical protein